MSRAENLASFDLDRNQKQIDEMDSNQVESEDSLHVAQVTLAYKSQGYYLVTEPVKMQKGPPLASSLETRTCGLLNRNPPLQIISIYSGPPVPITTYARRMIAVVRAQNLQLGLGSCCLTAMTILPGFRRSVLCFNYMYHFPR